MNRLLSVRMKLLSALVLALACFALAPGGVSAQVGTDVGAAPFNPSVYRVGERLSYNVSFSHFTTAAHVEMFVAGRGQFHGRDAVELRAHVETIGVVGAALYAVNNDYATFVEVSSGAPYRLEQVVRQGAQSADFAAAMTAAGGVAQPTPAQVSTPAPGTFDLLSAVYRLRALPLAQGSAYRLIVQTETGPQEVELRVTGRELLKTNVGSSNAIATQVRVPGNKSLNDYRIRIYFSDDDQRLPLLVSARLAAGELLAELAGIEMVTPQPAAAPPGSQLATPAAPAHKPSAGIALGPPTGPAGVPTTPRPAARPPTAGTNGPPPVADPAASLPFKVGEQLNFNFFAGTGTQIIGTASFHVRARARYFNRDGMLLSAQLQTTGPGQALFPVNDQFSSYVDASTFLPFRTELRVQEGPRRAAWVVSADQDRGGALFDDGTRVEINAGTHDLISVFYALRSFDLTPGRQSRVSLLLNRRVRLLSVTALRQADVQLNGQNIPAVELSLITSDPEGDRFALRLWVSTDKRRLPLRLTAQTPLGPIRADLAIIPVALQ
jgi:hypothetical protein